MRNKLQCHILYTFQKGAWGGCNQFLTALRGQLRRSGNWAESPEMADIILIDSFNNAAEAIRWKRRLPATLFIHRIDGPVSLYRGRDRYLDQLIHAIGARIADGVVFQSEYSKIANLSLGMLHPRLTRVVNNSAQKEHFWPGISVSKNGRIQLIAASWSASWNKGFEIYSYLDRHLDFSRYEMTFVGNTPISFLNIHCIPPQDIPELGALLRASDIYITASRHDPCSNSLLEALACGLPVAAICSGGHPELLLGGGELFSSTTDVIDCIDRVSADMDKYKAAIPRREIAQTARSYLSFFEEVHWQTRSACTLPLRGVVMLRLLLVLRRIWTLRDRVVQLLNQSGQHRKTAKHATK